ncbi:MAG: ABC transporter ATP-binding protein/permease [Ignavibacteria bacterium]|nr:ABC transporter ATP-binding protein/permease [Ignavibacteria bacterium]
MALKKLYPYIVSNRKKLILGFIFVTISNLLAVVIPRFVGKAIDEIASGKFLMETILWQIFLILSFTVASGFFMFLTRRTIIVASREIEYELRKDFIDKLSQLPYPFFTEHASGKLMSLATNDISAAREFLGPAIMYTANTITTFILALFFMLSLDVKLTLLSILPLPLITITTYSIGKRIHRHFKDVQEQFSKLTTHSQEVFSGIRLIRAYVREAYEALRFRELSEEYRKKTMKLEFFQSLMIPLLILLIGSSQLIVLGYGGLRVIDKTLTIGDITQFFVYINLLIWPVAAIGWVTNLIQRASASIERLWEIFEFKTEQKQKVSTILEKEKFTGKIQFVDVSFRYSDNLPWVLKNISFDVPPNSSFGIIGNVGSGKTTIVKLISKIYKPVSGLILIDDIPLEEIDESSLRKILAVVPQDPFLFSATIAENVKIGNPTASNEEVVHFLYLAGMEPDLKTFPDGIETFVGERGVTLSGGQKQRVAIARALASKPKILLLDDPFSSVDSETENFILTNIFKQLSKTTKIIISNRISTIMYCDKILLLDDGKIVEFGTHEELIAKGGRYYKLLELQKLSEEIENV